MITIQDLTWNNWFSFGDNNYINFEDSKFLQIMGKNGAGKTSIALILEEVFYGKNSRGIEKQKLANRNLSNPIVYAKCNFYDGFQQDFWFPKPASIATSRASNSLAVEYAALPRFISA